MEKDSGHLNVSAAPIVSLRPSEQRCGAPGHIREPQLRQPANNRTAFSLIARSSRSPSRCDSGLDVGYPAVSDGRAAMRLALFMVLMVVAAGSHAQPTAAP